jgi:hypothetical protein
VIESAFESRRIDKPDAAIFFVLSSVLSNQQYDAIIATGSEEIQLEITQAHEGESEFLRRLHLDEHGYAPATRRVHKSRVHKTGTKNQLIRTMIDRTATTQWLQVEAQTKLIAEAVHSRSQRARIADLRFRF